MFVRPDLNRSSAIPLYRQLYDHIRGGILSGGLPPGAKLPSRRSLADLCGLSPITVENACAQLLAEGYLAAEPRRGLFVAAPDIRPGECAPPAETAVPPRPVPPPRDARPACFDCHFGRIDVSAFPFPLWRKISREVFADMGPRLLLRGERQGEAVLRSEIAIYLYRFRGVRCEPEQIVIGAGPEWLILSLLPLVDPQAVFGLEEPGYAPYRHLLRAYGRRTVPIPVDAEGVLPKALAASPASILYLSPSHQFPLGGVLSFARRQQLLGWAREAPERLLLEDDYDSELRYRGLPIPSLQSLDEGGRVIYMGTFSKSLSPSLRIGYMVLPPPLAGLWRERTGFLSPGVSRIEQATLAAFMRQGHFERHLRRMRLLYRKKKDRLAELLRPYHRSLEVEDDGAGVFLRLYPHGAPSEREILEAARSSGIELTGLARWYERPPAKAGALLGFGGVPEEDMPRLAARLAESWGLY